MVILEKPNGFAVKTAKIKGWHFSRQTADEVFPEALFTWCLKELLGVHSSLLVFSAVSSLKGHSQFSVILSMVV